MVVRFVLTEYVNQALAHAVYDKLEDGTFTGRIPPCPGVIAFAASLRECEDELRSTLEEWIVVGLKLRHPLPVIGGIDLNTEPTREPMDTVLPSDDLMGPGNEERRVRLWHRRMTACLAPVT